MASNRFTTNDASPWLIVNETPIHIAVAGTFDSVSIALQQEIHETIYPVLDDVSAAIAYTVATDDPLNLNKGDKIRLVPTGGGGSLAVDWNVAGASISR